MQALWAFFSVLQFSAAVGLYIIRFVLLTNPIPWVAPFLKVLNRLLIKKRKSIGKRGDLYRIPVITVMGGLWHLLKTNEVFF